MLQEKHYYTLSNMTLSLGLSLSSILPKGIFVPVVNYSIEIDGGDNAFNFTRVVEIYSTYPTASILCTCDGGDDSILYNILPE